MNELRLYKLIEKTCTDKFFEGSDLYVSIKLSELDYFLKEIKEITGAKLNLNAERLELYLTETFLELNLTELISASAYESRLKEIFK